MIREVQSEDAQAICDIYNHYVADSYATFDENPIAVESIAIQIESQTYPWLVCESQGDIAGYAYARPWKDRSAYRFTVESTVYLHPQHLGKRIGSELYRELLDRLNSLNVHSVIAGIAVPNDASVRLHERLGFKKVCHFQQTGWKFDQWIDVGYWQLMLNRSEQDKVNRIVDTNG